MLNRKYKLIEDKIEALSDFGLFIAKLQKAYPEDFAEKNEILQKYNMLKGTNDKLEADKRAEEKSIQDRVMLKQKTIIDIQTNRMYMGNLISNLKRDCLELEDDRNAL